MLAQSEREREGREGGREGGRERNHEFLNVGCTI